MVGFVELGSPIAGTHDGLPVIVIGVLGDSRFMAIGGDGEVLDLAFSDVVVDLRFDIRERKWVDVGPMEDE